MDLNLNLLLQGVLHRLAAFPRGEPAEGVQQPLCLVLSLFIHCFDSSKNNVSGNRVCFCLGVLTQMYL